MIPTPNALVLILIAFAAGAVWAAAVAWFIWIWHERRALRIQSRMFDEAARWAREDAGKTAALLGDDDGWAIFDVNWQETRH